MEGLKIPRHIGFIMDGNGRWAKQRNKPRNFGHIHGSNRIDEVVTACLDLGVECVTLYAFSTENWARPKEEVDKIFDILHKFLLKFGKKLMANKIRLKISGDYTKFPKKTVNLIEKRLEQTKIFEGKILNIAINYGSKQEILRAVNTLIESGAKNVTESDFASALYTANIPDIDLVIRTSGEMRVSNFFLWQIAYAELYFTPVLWPDFDKGELLKAIEWYTSRDRRYGKV
ncbi:MAG: di-trans,poly-cis-decaprenylcistransferase [Clostridia bacterium]|nr:di-trans,poly-cis-decaprenylcistransferase [Clostridia bacterium]